jgi:hypothetical protein
MRFLFSILFATVFFLACNTKDTKAGSKKSDVEQNAILKDSANYTTIEWLDSTTKNFGKIPEGQKLDVAFHFKNTGTKPLIVTRVQPSCGCTIAEQPQEPIAPGAEGVIKASFNSEGRTGINHKTLFVFANTKGTQENQVQFTVEVDKKKF